MSRCCIVAKAQVAVGHFAASARMKRPTPRRIVLGTALSTARRLDEAVRAHEQTLRPRHAAARFHQPRQSCSRRNRSWPALVHFRAAIDDDPANVQAYRNLAWFIAQDGSARPRCARKPWLPARKRSP